MHIEESKGKVKYRKEKEKKGKVKESRGKKTSKGNERNMIPKTVYLGVSRFI